MSFLGFRETFLAAFLLVAVLGYVSIGAADGGAGQDVRSSCWASGDLTEDLARVARSAPRWSCAGAPPSLDAERVMLRFDVAAARPLPRYFLSRRSALEGVHLLAVDRSGDVRRLSLIHI